MTGSCQHDSQDPHRHDRTFIFELYSRTKADSETITECTLSEDGKEMDVVKTLTKEVGGMDIFDTQDFFSGWNRICSKTEDGQR